MRFKKITFAHEQMRVSNLFFQILPRSCFITPFYEVGWIERE